MSSNPKPLKPINWRQGNIAMSDYYFYLIYNNIERGITVNCTDRVTNKTTPKYGFNSMNDAQEWVEYSHHAEQCAISARQQITESEVCNVVD